MYFLRITFLQESMEDGDGEDGHYGKTECMKRWKKFYMWG